MEDVLVELEGRVEEGANFVLELVDHLPRLLVDEVFEPELVLLQGHLFGVIAVSEARVSPNNVHLLASRRNSSCPSEHAQKVVDIDGQVVTLILTNLGLVGEDQELLVTRHTYHHPHISPSPKGYFCSKYLLVLFSDTRKSTNFLDPVLHTSHAQSN